MIDSQINCRNLTQEILIDITNIDIGKFDYYHIPHKADFTKAITKSIVLTCKRLNYDVKLEYKIRNADKIINRYKNLNNAYVDVIVYKNGIELLAIEIDSSMKKWSYKKLEILNAQGINTLWFVWKRKTPGRKLKWRSPSDVGFNNKNIPIYIHTFIALEELDGKFLLPKLAKYKERTNYKSDYNTFLNRHGLPDN